ncbi:MAG: TonB-dependent receptor, partial [Thermoanaerobaculia bacterium]
MRKRTVQILAVFGLIFAVSLAASAQTTTGRLRGKAQGPDGMPIPGVTVTISGEALPGGARIAVTGETGAYRFTALPPGVYNVIAQMDGFQTQTLADIRVGIGSTADADFVMYGEFAEAVTVTSESPLVDMASSGSSATFTAEFIEDLPTTRNFYDMIGVSPGVSVGAEDSDRMVAYGSNVQSNAWFTDGIELTAPETGTNWVGVNPDMVQEIQVMGIGAPAEFGNMLGAAMNVVTKSGTNQFTGTANAYWFNNSLVDNAIDVPDQEFPGYEQVDSFWDVTATLGGPIKKDRVWFFAGYEYWRDGHAWPTQDPALLPVQYQDRYDLKLSARINDKNLLDFKGGITDWGYPAAPNEFTSPSASAGEIGDDTVWG